MNTRFINKIVMDILRNCPLESEYDGEERGLQPFLEKKAFNENGVTDLETKMSVGNNNTPRVDLLGTNFWPDIEISLGGNPVLAIEVKYQKKSLPAALALLIGQCLIYKLKYRSVIGFILHRGPINPNYNEYD